MNSLSRSFVGVAGGIVVLFALGTIGFVSAGFLSALANPRSGTDIEGENRNLSMMPNDSTIQETGDFVLAQGQMSELAGMGGMGGGIGRSPKMPKELVVKWEKPTSPAPPRPRS